MESNREVEKACQEIASERYEKFDNPEDGVYEFLLLFARDNKATLEEGLGAIKNRSEIRAWLDGWMSGRHFYQFRNECVICHCYIEEDLNGCNVCELCNEDFIK